MLRIGVADGEGQVALGSLERAQGGWLWHRVMRPCAGAVQVCAPLTRRIGHLRTAPFKVFLDQVRRRAHLLARAAIFGARIDQPVPQLCPT